jgi:aspartate racemase
MRTIGMLGGMSWESTAEYYRLANQAVRERLGGTHSAKIVLDSVDFAQIEAMQEAGDWDAAGQLLAERARALEAAGADLLVLCTNTMHLVADTIESAVEIPLLHLDDITADAVSRASLSRVGLLATAFTMEQSFYVDRMREHGIEAIVPDAEDRELVHRVIYEELVVGVVSDTSRREYQQVIQRLVDRGAQGIILGCTEIELLIGADDAEVPVFPTTRLHAQAAVDAALGARPGL